MEAPQTALPCPIFEGSEKRLEVDFYTGKYSPADGLRALSRAQLDSLLEQVQLPPTFTPNFKTPLFEGNKLNLYILANALLSSIQSGPELHLNTYSTPVSKHSSHPPLSPTAR